MTKALNDQGVLVDSNVAAAGGNAGEVLKRDGTYDVDWGADQGSEIHFKSGRCTALDREIRLDGRHWIRFQAALTGAGTFVLTGDGQRSVHAVWAGNGAIVATGVAYTDRMGEPVNLNGRLSSKKGTVKYTAEIIKQGAGHLVVYEAQLHDGQNLDATQPYVMMHGLHTMARGAIMVGGDRVVFGVKPGEKGYLTTRAVVMMG